jgi:protein-disulfide isomerase
MAGRVNPKAFYGVLVAIAVVGTAAVWLASRRSTSDTTQLIDAPVPVDVSAFAGYVMGSDTAPVEIVEYADFTCGACGSFTILQSPDVRQRLVEPGLARLRFRAFALNQGSLLPMNAADCAGEQGRFWEMHDQLMFGQRDWISANRPMRMIRDYARDIGLDMDAYDQCMDEGRFMSRIIATREEISSMGIHQTPTFDVGQFRVSGAISYDSLKVLVDKAAAQAGAGGS